jgi:hypothetical protein
MPTAHNGHDAPASEEVAAQSADAAEDGGLNTTVATVVIVAAGAALFEAALLPGIAIGVAAVAAPKYLPKLAGALNPCSSRRFVAPTSSHRNPKRCSPRRMSR